MIFFGTREKKIKWGKISNVTCTSCKENTKMYYLIEAKYFHLYWIPIFPFKKKIQVECDLCEEVFEQKQFSENIKTKLLRENELKPAKSPIWMFSGLIAIAILIPLAILQSNNTNDKESKLLDKPMIGDVYFYEKQIANDQRIYTAMKIKSIEKNRINFIQNDTQVTKYIKVFNTNKNRLYTNKEITFEKNKLKSMFEKSIIFNIERE